MSFISEVKRLTPEELLEKRRLTLLSRTQAARLQLDSLSSLDSSYETCRQTLRQWRTQMLEQINRAHETSLTDLNHAYEQLNRFRSTILHHFNENDTHAGTTLETSLHTLRNAEFTFDFDRASQLEGELQLLKLSNPQTNLRTFNKSTTKCRLLVPHDRYVSDVFFYDELIQRIDGQTAECILVCPFDLLGELLGNTEDDEEVRILIDQSYLSAIGTHAQRMRIDYDLTLLQPAPECCPQSTERVIRIVCHDRSKLLAFLEEIYTICTHQALSSTSIPYDPVNHNRSKIHLYGGYSDTPTNGHLITSSSQQHFDRVLMPVAICQTLPITDMQAGALLGPKGERIQQLQRETGAIVNIGDLNDENGERRKRLVNIQGNQQQVNNALQAIRRVLMINHNDDDGGGGGGNTKKI